MSHPTINHDYVFTQKQIKKKHYQINLGIYIMYIIYTVSFSTTQTCRDIACLRDSEPAYYCLGHFTCTIASGILKILAGCPDSYRLSVAGSWPPRGCLPRVPSAGIFAYRSYPFKTLNWVYTNERKIAWDLCWVVFISF